MTNAGSELHVEDLLGNPVIAMDGRNVGRLEEIVAVQRGDHCLIEEYHVGVFAILERLAALPSGRALLNLFGPTRRRYGYRIHWTQIELRPNGQLHLTCAEAELRRMEG
jgi:hypothetical protein